MGRKFSPSVVRLTCRVVRVNKLIPTLILELVDGDGKRRLRHEQFFRCTAKTALMGYLHESPDVPQR